LNQETTKNLISNKLCIYITETNAINNTERQKKRTNEIPLLCIYLYFALYFVFFWANHSANPGDRLR